jgi:hypothetical protein
MAGKDKDKRELVQRDKVPVEFLGGEAEIFE